ncbi:PREDICTED: cyclin-D4-1-like isoform X2 [Tarenaya hassleriana]|uniref:cyclin-D4-1-like isoform X2 n=1 Tax=Tarenaya hassleriana TaxID=28532 RepID=UPI00053C5129|nr:PREDICTED: cyclin-D4-1-like isoform X2 [Tarenaya hassleriana]
MAENLELNLLCTESAIDDATVDGENDDKTPVFRRETPNIEMGFPVESEEIIREMMERERDHLPRDDYLRRLRSGDLDLNVRREALDWIWKACGHHRFGPLSLCLSTNFLDRFLSVHDLPSGKSWTVQLLAVACLSLAAKIEETNVPELVDLQAGDPRFLFEPKSVQRMELLVLNELKWRLRAITPCSYIRYFLSRINGCDQEPPRKLITRSLQVISSTSKSIDFLEFRPSEVAAAVTLSVSGQIGALPFDNSSPSPFSLLEKERVKKIARMIESEGSVSSSLSWRTPNGVLDVTASCFSFKTDDSSASLSPLSPSDTLTRQQHSNSHP